MLREINAARDNNTASHQLSRSALSVSNMPAPSQLLSESDRARQPDTDRKNAGVQPAPGPLDNFRVNLLA